jgi:hypothetical protein
MFWAPCVRVDFPIGAPSHEVRWYAAALDPIVTAIEASEVTMTSLAISGAALLAFDRHGLKPLIDRIAELAADRRIELAATAAHGGLLPLMPEEEAQRQILINDSINRMYFGDAFRPVCLWPPMLAISQKVVKMAARLGFSSLLVDEAAMRIWPAVWPGNRIDFVEHQPGLFLLPSSRRASRAFERGSIRVRADLEQLSPDLSPGAKTYLITAEELSPRSAAYRAWLATLDQEPTVTLERLFNHFPLSRSTSPLPCSALSTPEELSNGLPFAEWFRPGHEQHSMQWRLMTQLAKGIEALAKEGLVALPSYQLLRDVADRSWRESWWRVDQPEQVSEQIAEIRVALEPLQSRLPETLQREIAELMQPFSHDLIPTRAPRIEEPMMMH